MLAQRDPKDPDDSGLGWSHEEIERTCLLRPQEKWTPIPTPGSVVYYRHDHHGDATEAHVIAVQSLDDKNDPNLWATMPDGRKVPRPDPWPTLILDTLYGRVQTREARARGSAGWLPLDFPDRT